MTARSGAERQRRYRERNAERLAQERAAARERLRQRELAADACCACCGESRPVFLASDTSCWNCAHAEEVGGICPHKAISRRLR